MPTIVQAMSKETENTEQEQNGRKTLPEQVAELLRMLSRFGHQQVSDVVNRSAAEPIKKAGVNLGVNIASATLFALAAIFLAISAFLLVLVFLPAWLAIGLVGIVLVAAGLLIRVIGGRNV